MVRLVVVLPLHPLRVGDSFAVATWPLHVTVLPPFLTDATPAEITAAIAAATRAQLPLTVRAGQDELFGRPNNLPVTLIEPHDGLTALHRGLIDAVRPFAAVPDEPAFTGAGFRGHVTVKSPARVHAGDTLTLSQIALVDMLPRAHAAGRTVLATLPLPSPARGRTKMVG
jgi:2'-5' RNA ligase